MVEFIFNYILYLIIGIAVLIIVDLGKGKLMNWANKAPFLLLCLVVACWPVVAFLYLANRNNT